MRARAIREFLDAEADRVRKEGEAFEVTPERFNAINATRWGILAVEDKKKDKEGRDARNSD